MNVPNGWLKTNLKELINIKHGFSFKSEFFREKGDHVLLTPGSFYEKGGFRDQKSKTKFYVGDLPVGYLLSKGSLLIAMTEQAAGLLGSTLCVPEDNRYLHNQRLGLVEIQSYDSLIYEYVYLLYNSPFIRKQIAEQSTGTKVKHTSPDKLKSVMCLLPPIPEQRKIAKILGTWDKVIATTEKLITTSKQQKKALMQQLLTGKKRLINPGTSVLFDGDWEEVTLGRCISHVGGTALEKHVCEDAKHHFISIGNYSKDGRYIDKGQRVKLNDKTKSKLLCKNDLVMVLNDKTKTGDIIGSTLLIEEDDKYIYNQRSERITPNSGIDTLFFWCLLNSKYFRMEVFKRSQGGTQIYVNFGSLKTILLTLPLLSEQQKIASVLTVADKEVEILKTKLSHLQQEKKALMQQLLTGKRRVKVEEELEVAN